MKIKDLFGKEEDFRRAELMYELHLFVNENHYEMDRITFEAFQTAINFIGELDLGKRL